jgi:hypothetical protein
MRKKTKKYANIITNLQYLQFMKEVAGRTSTSGGPHAARVFETAVLTNGLYIGFHTMTSCIRLPDGQIDRFPVPNLFRRNERPRDLGV